MNLLSEETTAFTGFVAYPSNSHQQHYNTAAVASDHMRHRCYSDNPALYSETFSNIIKSTNTVNDMVKEMKNPTACNRSCSQANKMKHQYVGHLHRPRSKSESDSHFHLPHRSLPIHKKKQHVHFASSPVKKSPKYRSLGKMWIRPVPVRQIPVHPILACPNLPFFPGLTFSSNTLTPKEAPPMEIGQVGNGSTSYPATAAAKESGTLMNGPIHIPMLYNYPNSSFESFQHVDNPATKHGLWRKRQTHYSIQRSVTIS